MIHIQNGKNLEKTSAPHTGYWLFPGSDVALASPVLCSGEFLQFSYVFQTLALFSNKLCLDRAVQERIQSCCKAMPPPNTTYENSNNEKNSPNTEIPQMVNILQMAKNFQNGRNYQDRQN